MLQAPGGRPAACPNGSLSGRNQAPVTVFPSFELVETFDHAAHACHKLESADILALDIETYSAMAPIGPSDKPAVDPHRNRVRLVQVASSSEHVVIFDLLRLGGLPPPLRELLKRDRPCIGFNIKFDLKNLLHHFDVRIEWPVDLFVAAVLDQGCLGTGERGEKGRYTLASVVRDLLNEEVDKTEQRSDWGRPKLSTEQLQYAALDVGLLFRLFARLRDRMERASLNEAWDLENAIILPLAEIELAGFAVDVPGLKKKMRRWDKSMVKAGASVLNELGAQDLDLDSPAQLRKAFSARHGVSIASTATEALRELPDDDAARSVIEYRELAILRNRYAQAWLAAAAHDGRLHPTFHTLGAPTGRMSCSAPNIQAVPRDGDVRSLFIARPGCILIVADYGAIELRVIAQMVGEPELRRCFCSDPPIDPHKRTAAFVMGKEIDAVTSEERKRAKAANFGFCYGMGAEAFIAYAKSQYEVILTRPQAQLMRQKYFGLYRGLARWHQAARLALLRDGFVTTASGRVRLFDGDTKITEVLNTPIQGTAADGMKRAVALVYRRLRPLRSQIVNLVHDEIVVEAPVELADEAKRAVVEEMVTGMQEYLPDVPVVVESQISRNWSKT
ncbi:MAG: DNA polymerase [Deltaproteobacteria bacterium]|nr:DNA polymerase [Deltaproteobacteria bacterium]